MRVNQVICRTRFAWGIRAQAQIPCQGGHNAGLEGLLWHQAKELDADTCWNFAGI